MTGPIETLAAILIVVSVVKIITLIVHPESWFVLTKKVFNKPKISSGVLYVLAAVVLYFLVKAGISIVQIFAITLFVSLLLGAGLIKYLPEMIKKYKPNTILKENWFYALVWLVLLIWGIIALIQ